MVVVVESDCMHLYVNERLQSTCHTVSVDSERPLRFKSSFHFILSMFGSNELGSWRRKAIFALKKKTVIIQKYQCDCAGACNDDLHHCMVCIQCLPRWQRRQHTYSFQLFHLYSFLCTGESIKPHTHFIFFLPLAFYSTTFFIIRIFMFCRWIFIIIL